MRLETSLSHRLELQQKLAPQLIQSIEILQLPALDLQELIQQELMENEVLEVQETRETEKEEPLPEPPATESDKEFERLESLLSNIEEWNDSAYRPGPSAGSSDPDKDRKMEAMNNTTSKPATLHDHLYQQLRLTDAPFRLKALAEQIIYNLDENGFLRVGLEELLVNLQQQLELDQARRDLAEPPPPPPIRPDSSPHGDTLGESHSHGDSPNGSTSSPSVFTERPREDESSQSRPVFTNGQPPSTHRIRPVFEPDSDPTLDEDEDEDVLASEEITEEVGALDLAEVDEDDEDLESDLEANFFTLAEAEQALRMVQNLDPRGVGARDISECLTLQINQSDPDASLLRRLIEGHFQDICKNRIPKVAKEMGEDIEVIKMLIDRVRHLNFRPGAEFTMTPVPYVRPDVILEYVDGNYEIRLEDDYYPKLRLSPRYRKMYEEKKNDPKVREYIKRKIESARWLIDAIEQRQNTLFRVVSSIVRRQRDFLDHGPQHLHPLKMQEVADELGIHVSTVSRAISEKYVQCHRGIYPLKFFFTGGTETADGDMVSRLDVKQRVQQIVDQENKESPLSDEEIAEKLQEQGLNIARRTVTKYRKALRIPSSRQRRQF
ncbi:MAG: RNA polymerase factor sigma-54 [Planctomycetota bacterium]